MKTHELHCTKNPNRVCRLCGRSDRYNKPVSYLVSVLEECIKIKREADKSMFLYQVPIDINPLRKAAYNCPACILAAIRQHDNTPYALIDFDFKKELQKFWDRQNEE